MIPALPDEPGFAGALNLVNHGAGEAILILLSGRPPSKRKDRSAPTARTFSHRF